MGLRQEREAELQSNQASIFVPSRDSARVVVLLLDVILNLCQSYHLKPGLIGGGMKNLLLFDVVDALVVAEGHLRGMGVR